MADRQELIDKSACEMVELLDAGEISPDDALDTLEARIAQVDRQVNALPTLCFERARDQTRRLRDIPPADRGLLRGLPVPIKDLTNVAGVRTTFGSKLLEDNTPDITGAVAQTLENNGAVIYAKSNTPEFGTGGHTFNDVFGTTRNPHDLSKSAGGSSGGAAAALASGTAWLAHGSDMAGSLRTPASFCGIASLRPSPGLIATDPGNFPFQFLGQEGPMARSVEDVALLTDAMCGLSHRAGLSKPAPATSFLSAARHPRMPQNVAFSPDLDLTQTSREVREAFDKAMKTLAGSGMDLEETHPDLSDAEEAFTLQRALIYAGNLGGDLEKTRNTLKPEVVWNVEKGLAAGGDEIRSALMAQGRVFESAAGFMQDHDVFVCPATIVSPFPAEERYPGSSSGVPISDYYGWLKIVYAITATSLPVITIPCGRTADGLPLGIQLVGKPHGEQALFSIARYLEEIFGWDLVPVDPARR
ncbi:amidase [Hoeflea sp. TYP-13]|uniref:amidase n=1 Tax=Hoeflea sp. TYP-13 TaxID=3230023 RepID=UPI0034C6465B